MADRPVSGLPLSKLLGNPIRERSLSLLQAVTAFLPAEQAHASGVLAAGVSGRPGVCAVG
ncbi:hypothetical protein AB0H43_26090 [Hamadaea sp. NPDC050747]|uniref:hypothetical protein n=1 Tax=Hamadaea sp. NPDC050747 TaxID=3155789 RepID=UPI0033FB69E6